MESFLPADHVCRATDSDLQHDEGRFDNLLRTRLQHLVEQIDGLIAKLSFEEMNELGEGDPGLDKRMDEKGKKLPPEQAKKVRHMVNSVPESKKVITSSANKLVEGHQGQGIKLSGDDGRLKSVDKTAFRGLLAMRRTRFLKKISFHSKNSFQKKSLVSCR